MAGMAMTPAQGALLMTVGAIDTLTKAATNTGNETAQEQNPLKPLADIATAPARMELSHFRDQFLKGLV